MPRKALKVWEMITRPWPWPRLSKALLCRGRSLPSDATAAVFYEEDHDEAASAGSMSTPLTPLRAAMAPKGYIAVYVGAARSRFLIPAEMVNHERFRELLDEAEREYGFHSDGPLTLPCDVEMFRNVLHHILSPPSSPVAKNWCPRGCFCARSAFTLASPLPDMSLEGAMSVFGFGSMVFWVPCFGLV